MNMECKNCSSHLQENHDYCNSCGAKVIRNRLTFNNLFEHFSEEFLNYDNKFLRTFIGLFKRPEDVIGGYIGGTRKKYVNAVGYFAIAVTVSGFFYFVFLKFFPDAFNFTTDIYNIDEEQAKITSDFNKSIFEYQSFIFFISIPVFALISRLIFLKNKKYNFSEHLIINLYTYSHISLTVTVIYFLTIWNQPVFVVVTVIAFLFQIVFFAYVLKRLYGLTLGQILLKTLLFFSLLIPLMIILMIVAIILMYFGGYYDEFIELEKAKRGITYIASSAINWTS
jgi:uncharacterized protein DUF3667